MFDKLSKITFMTSESCNLKCSYCEIAKNSSDHTHKEEVENIKKSLISGEYITRYMYIFHKFNIDPKQIKEFELWGQEPTLTLDEFTTQIGRILKWLPNIEHCFFSTNGVAYPDKIVNYIKTINNFFTIQESEKDFDILIQFSFDGIDYTKKQRGINPQFIINNIKKIILALNDIHIKNNLHIKFTLHGVITMDIIKESLNDSNNTYWHSIDNITYELQQLNNNQQIHITQSSSFLQAPYNATTEEGKLLGQYMQYCINHLNDVYKTSPISVISPTVLTARSINTLINDFITPEGINGHIKDNFNFNYGDIPDNPFISHNYGCGVGIWDIKMRYDGTLLYCQNMIFGIKKENLENKQGISYDIQRYELNHPSFQPNLLTSSKKDIEKFINIFDTKKHYAFHFIVSNNINLMYLLLKNNQIDESYNNNFQKILRHSILLASFMQCYYNNIIDTGSLYNLTLGIIRFYCNGAIDAIEEYIDEWSQIGQWK